MKYRIKTVFFADDTERFITQEKWGWFPWVNMKDQHWTGFYMRKEALSHISIRRAFRAKNKLNSTMRTLRYEDVA